MSDADEEYVVYQNKERGYFNYTTRNNYASWARTRLTNIKFYTIIARGLTQEQARVMVDLTRED